MNVMVFLFFDIIFYGCVLQWYWGEGMEIIIELIYGLHMMMLLISYECMTILLQINPSFKKMLKECFILSSSFILLFFDEGNSFVFMVWFLLFFILYRKRVFLYFPTFMIVYCTVVFFISSLSYYSYVYNGICIVQIGFSFILSTVVMVLCLLTTTMYIVYCRKKIKQIDFMYDVKLLMGQRVVCLNMLLDSGNDLYYAGFPMIVLSRHRVTGYVVIDQI